MEFDFEIEHIAGVEHQVTNALPRLRTVWEDYNELQYEFIVIAVTRTKNHDRKISSTPSLAQMRKSPPYNAEEQDERLSTSCQLIIAQAKVVLRERSCRLVGLTASMSTFEKNGILEQKPLRWVNTKGCAYGIETRTLLT